MSTIKEKIRLKDLDKSQLVSLMIDQGLQPYRAKQIFHWMYQKRSTSFSEMTTIKKSVRDLLENTAALNLLKMVMVKSSRIDATKKFLFELSDGHLIESVYMKDGKRITICLSSQVGCALNCSFCATGKMGFTRNLTSGEIIEQVLMIERYVGYDASNLVIMGMGEPFLNYDRVVQAAEILSDPEGIAVSKRKITISTSGIVPGMIRYADEKRRFKLAISLNATSDDIRKKLMPIAKKYALDDVLNAAKYYVDRVQCRITFEYLLIAGINDSEEDTKRLKNFVKHIPCKINLIPYNPIDSDYQSITEKKLNWFVRKISTISAPVTVRRSKGQDIQAACGQLYTALHSENF